MSDARNNSAFPVPLDNEAFRYCRKIDAAHPASGFVAFATTYAERVERNNGAAMGFPRRLLWVN